MLCVLLLYLFWREVLVGFRGIPVPFTELLVVALPCLYFDFCYETRVIGNSSILVTSAAFRAVG